MYIDPIIKKYTDLIAGMMPDFKVIYQGEPTAVPASNLPCLIISKRATAVGKETNVEDAHEIGLSFTVVTDIRSELSTSQTEGQIIEGVAQLYDMVEGREADYTLKTNSLLGILRGNLWVDQTANLRTDLSTVTRVDYGETLQKRDPTEWRIQARIDVVAQFIQNR